MSLVLFSKNPCSCFFFTFVLVDLAGEFADFWPYQWQWLHSTVDLGLERNVIMDFSLQPLGVNKWEDLSADTKNCPWAMSYCYPVLELPVMRLAPKI